MINALKLGETLENPRFWKKIQLYLIIFGVTLPGLGMIIPETQSLIDKGILGQTLSAVSVVIGYLTVATTTKLGA